MLKEQNIQTIFKNIVLTYKSLIENKICYKNIKPSNIFIDEKLNIKFGDYGVLCFLNIANHKSYLKLLIQNGTLLYQPPENIFTHEVI